METLIRADIFFFITSIFVALLTVGGVIALFFIIPILKDLRYLSKIARKEGDKLAGDIGELRDAVKEEGARVRSIADYFLDLFIRRRKAGRKK